MELIFSFILSLGFIAAQEVAAESRLSKEEAPHGSSELKEKKDDFLKVKKKSTDHCPDSFWKCRTWRQSKVKTFLSPKERLALKDCLLSEYFGKMYPPAQKKNLKHDGLLIDYLLETECPKK